MSLHHTVDRYDSARFTLNNGASDVDIASTVSDLFDDVPEAQYVEISTTQNISIKLNANTNKSIQIASTSSPYTIKRDEQRLAVTNIFGSNASGSNSTVDIFLT